MKTLLSIVIPTKNRQTYCLSAVESILSLPNSNIQIVVQDNSDDLNLSDMLGKFKSDSRMVYRYTPPPFSSVDNCNAAVELATGEYIIMIGDDDTILKSAISVAEWAKENNIDSIVASSPVTYIWPNSNSKDFKDGTLKLGHYNSKIQKAEPKSELLKLVKAGFISYQSYKLPRLYHGIIRRSCMEEIKEKTGYYFQGLSPDIYSTIALVNIVRNHFIINYPLSIAGACPASTTVEATTGAHSGKIEDAPHLKNRKDYIWDSLIPRYYSVETIWAETAVKSLKDIGQVKLLKNFNKFRLYTYGLHYNRKYIKTLSVSETYKIASVLKMSKLEFYIRMKTEYVKTIFRVITKKFIAVGKGSVTQKQFSQVLNIQAAIDLTTLNLNKLEINN